MIRLLLPLLALWLVGCSGSSTRPALSPAELKPFEQELALSSRWSVQVDKGVGRRYLRMTPLLDGSRVYAADRRGLVVAYTEAQGDPVWQVALQREVSAGVGDGGALLLFGGNAEVFALSKADGHEVWRTAVSSEVVVTPVASGSQVVVRTVDGGLSALDLASGEQLWRYQQPVPALSLRGGSLPVIVNGLVVTGFANGKVMALELESGRLQWESIVAIPRGRTELERMVDVDAHLAVVDGIVYAASYEGTVAAFLLGDGRKLWEREMGSFSGLAHANGVLYLVDNLSHIWALAANSGGTLWKQPWIEGRYLSAPVVQGEFLLVGDFEGYLHWMAREDGHFAGRTRVEDWDYYFPIPPSEPESPYQEDRGIIGTPVVEGDSVYALDKRGVLNVFRVRVKHTGTSGADT